MFTPSEALAWWLQLHHGQVELAAIAAGVNPTAVRRWKRAGKVPDHTCKLIDQIANGPAFSAPIGHGVKAVRPDWLPTMGKTLELVLERRKRDQQNRLETFSRTFRRNQAFRAGYRLPLR